MQYNGEINLSNSESVIRKSGEKQISVAANNHLESLRILSESILQEVDSLRREESISMVTKINLSKEVQNYEADLIRCALLRCGGTQRKAARLLGVKVSTLNAKIKRLGVEVIAYGIKLS